MHRYQVCFYADDSKLTLERKICVYANNGNSALKIAKEQFNKKTNVSRTVMLWEGPDK
ncbi:hypothetical protein [Acinetobacter soli]|uniref:hypothetical protein n=1 Tax=Acinetobacter soli TaxID=487316 RepID=UPI001ABCB764|nr:hypothetical protein [Acinetobacter soli]MBO3640146.1 hypothetical protein [Acinetobacter soli]